MSSSKYIDKICIFLTVLMVIITLLFINSGNLGVVAALSDAVADDDGLFSDRDLDAAWDSETAVDIQLDDMEHLAANGAYSLNGDLYIVSKGVYVLSGSLENHQIIVEAKGAKIQIVLNGVTIDNQNLSPIYVKKADKVFLTLAENSENTLTTTDLSAETDGIDAAIYSNSDLTINGSGSLYVSTQDGHGIKTVDDLVITGGSLTVNAAENALLGKDSVRICDGLFTLTAGKDGIKANNDSDEDKGYVTITGGTFVIEAANDGIQAETNVTIEGGDFDITTNGGYINGTKSTGSEFGFGGGGDNGFNGQMMNRPDKSQNTQNSSETDDTSETTDSNRGMPTNGMQMPDGNQQMPTDGGTQMPDGNQQMPTDNAQMPDGNQQMPTDGMQMPDGNQQMPTDGAQMPDGMQMPMGDDMTEAAEASETETAETEEAAEAAIADNSTSNTSDSYKGIKAGKLLTINGGTLNLDCADDGIHSNGDVTITSGTLTISSGDDGIHADDSVLIFGGEITISQSYEGIEGNQIEITDGTIDVTTSDDGLNANGGSDGFGFGRMMNWMTNSTDNDSSDESEDTQLPLLNISGGSVHVNAGGDGLDSNGDLIIDGGDIVVDGPSDSSNGALDAGSENGGDCIVNGGTIIALGASGMAETFTENSSQYSFECVFTSNFAAGDSLNITDADGNTIYSYTVQKSGNSIVFSSPELKEGAVYTVTVGDLTSEVTLDSIATGSDNGNFQNPMKR